MALNKSVGNMFDHVTHTHSHIGGECPQRCSYCYVGKIPNVGRPHKYVGAIRLVEHELNVNYGEGRKIFVENCNDLFADAIPADMIRKVLDHCCRYPKNEYLFHTKNPARYADFLNVMPGGRILGCTAETNRPTPSISLAPAPMERLAAMSKLPGQKLITIEPVLKFDLDEFVKAILAAKPDKIIVGADSKGCHLAEPTKQEMHALLGALQATGIPLKQKGNLTRLLV